jgi:hypothetical protein
MMIRSADHSLFQGDALMRPLRAPRPLAASPTDDRHAHTGQHDLHLACGTSWFQPPEGPDDVHRVEELFDAARRLAVDQPLLECRLGELHRAVRRMLEGQLIAADRPRGFPRIAVEGT